jgi:hypothetical protein
MWATRSLAHVEERGLAEEERRAWESQRVKILNLCLLVCYSFPSRAAMLYDSDSEAYHKMPYKSSTWPLACLCRCFDFISSRLVEHYIVTFSCAGKLLFVDEIEVSVFVYVLIFLHWYSWIFVVIGCLNHINVSSRANEPDQPWSL